MTSPRYKCFHRLCSMLKYLLVSALYDVVCARLECRVTDIFMEHLGLHWLKGGEKEQRSCTQQPPHPTASTLSPRRCLHVLLLFTLSVCPPPYIRLSATLYIPVSCTTLNIWTSNRSAAAGCSQMDVSQKRISGPTRPQMSRKSSQVDKHLIAKPTPC